MGRRGWHILRVAIRHRLDTLLAPELLETLQAPSWLKVALRLNPLRLLPTQDRSDGERLRATLVELGPVYIKLGQLLSTRPDVVPPDLAQELALLQDTVPPIPVSAAKSIIEEDLGASIAETFASFNEEPLAAASIAQVHTATLQSGEEVVVKVVRPNLAQDIALDLALFRDIATRLERRHPEAHRLHLNEVLDDYERTILAELDMLAEADNTARLRANFADSKTLYVPRVYRDLCRSRVLVMERIYGVPVSDVQTLTARGVDLELLANRGVETFFTQVFVDNFFHADMHPGNVYVDTANPQDPRYIALDCAIMGSLEERDQEYLARNLLAFFHQDYREVARLHVHSGWVPADIDVAQFERVIREVCEPIFAKPLSEISFGEFLVELFRTAEQFQMQVQPQLVLLQKTLLYIEGLGRTLYPQLDLWTTAQPFMERWLAERLGPTTQIRHLIERAPELLQAIPQLPAQLNQIRLEQAQQARELNELRAQLGASKRKQRHNRLLGSAMLLVAAVLVWPAATADWATPVGILSALAGSAILLRPN